MQWLYIPLFGYAEYAIRHCFGVVVRIQAILF